MDKRLNDLWLAGGYPFNQETIILEDLTQISDLLRCLQRVTNNLENKFGNVTLYHNHDWHQHDGFINNSKVISWEEIKSDLENEKTLYDSRHGDDYVRITIYSGTLEFTEYKSLIDNGCLNGDVDYILVVKESKLIQEVFNTRY